MSQRETENARRLQEPGQAMDAVAAAVIDAAIEVHRVLGPGFFESVYQQALDLELSLRSISFVRQPAMDVLYKGCLVGELRPDLLIADSLIVELKTVDQLGAVHLAQALAYLKAAHLPLALVINFNVPILLRGVRRVVHSTETANEDRQS